MLIVRRVLTNFIILIIIIINVFADDLLDNKETENSTTSKANDFNNNVVDKDIKSECESLRANNQTEINQSYECLANSPTRITRIPTTDEAIAEGIASSGTCEPVGKEKIKAEVYNLLEIYRNENNVNVVPNNEDILISNKSTQTESLSDKSSELLQPTIQQHYLSKENYNIDGFNDSSSCDSSAKASSSSDEDLHAQQVNILINDDSIYLQNSDFTIIQQITETINIYDNNIVFVSAGSDINTHRLSLWHSIELMQSKFINCPLYSNYYLNSQNVSVGINEYIGNHMMVGLALSYFKRHHMLSNNNILTRSFNYVSLYGKYDFNNGISIQNIIGTTYSIIDGYTHNLQNTNSINWSHFYNNLKLNTKLYPFKNNSNILLTISNDITFFYTNKANVQQNLALDTSIKCSIGYIRPKVMTEIYYLLCCNIWNNENAQTQLNKDSNIPLVSDFNIFHRHTIGTKLTIKTNIITFSMSIGSCFQNNYITNFGTLRIQVNF